LAGRETQKYDNDLSALAIVVHATSVIAVSGFSGTPDAPGNANPDNDFRFDATLGPSGGYIFNLSTGGLASGTYSSQFTARQRFRYALGELWSELTRFCSSGEFLCLSS
jgi:hypothetical protein